MGSFGLIKLSILIPSIPERLEKLNDVISFYESMIAKYSIDAEILSFTDNKKRSIGRKRTDLLRLAQGEYVVMSDEDDRLTRRYFEKIVEAMASGADVITYFQFARINDDYTFVNFRLRGENEYQNNAGITQRPAWHCCTWKRDVVKDIEFSDTNYGEDDDWQREANRRAVTERHIPEVCHIYEHDSHLTAAFL